MAGDGGLGDWGNLADTLGVRVRCATFVLILVAWTALSAACTATGVTAARPSPFPGAGGPATASPASSAAPSTPAAPASAATARPSLAVPSSPATLPPASTRGALVETALDLRGIPYHVGGNA